jgi:hypothetical protein
MYGKLHSAISLSWLPKFAQVADKQEIEAHTSLVVLETPIELQYYFFGLPHPLYFPATSQQRNFNSRNWGANEHYYEITSH